MAFRGLLELTGVVPLAAPPAATTPGLALGQASGVWITGGSSGASVPGLSFLQASGVWITGAPEAVVPPAEPNYGGGSSGLATWRGRSYPVADPLWREEEDEILAILLAFMEDQNGPRS